MPVAGNCGYNVALEMLNAHTAAFDYYEVKNRGLLDQLEQTHATNEALSRLLQALTNAKAAKKADFSEDDEMRAIIDQLHAHNPRIFGHSDNHYVWASVDDIDATLTTLDSEAKLLANRISELASRVGMNFDSTKQLTENGTEVMNMNRRHIENILGRMRGGG